MVREIKGLGHGLGRHIVIMPAEGRECVPDQAGMIEKPPRPWPKSLMPKKLERAFNPQIVAWQVHTRNSMPAQLGL